MAKVEWHPGELYPRVGFILTNLAAERVRTFYNQRGIAEQWIKEGKGAIKWTRLSCRTFAANAVRLQLHALWEISGVRSSHHLGNFGCLFEKSFARGSERSKATVSVVCRQAAFNNTANRGHCERVLP
jgi:hypothetical protein